MTPSSSSSPASPTSEESWSLPSWNLSTRESPSATTCPPLSPEETRHYVAHHMKLAGAKEPILDEQALQAVHELSFGIPRKIGAITEQALTYAMFDQKRTVTPEMVLRVKNLEG